MKNKVAIYTLNGFTNYGNRLQNYALVYYINNLGIPCENLWNMSTNEKIKCFLKIFIPTKKYRRIKKFIKFNRNIFTSYKNKKYNYIVVGSDQVWNPFFSNDYKNFLLKKFDVSNKISYSASFGIDFIPENMHDIFKEELLKFKAISVREERGKQIVENLTNRKDVEILIDPTMLLSATEWDKISKKPKQFEKIKGSKYILNYFLGKLSDSKRYEIEKIAKKNDCCIIDILNKNDPFYTCGPSEFLYLIKHAFLVCTDSFHSSVFSILYNKPFIIYNRDDDKGNMSSRIETLIGKFKLKNRRYNGENITQENLEHDYTDAYKILEEERKKSDRFLRNALDIKDGE